jgi:ATP dependent DNA ligase domain
MVSQLAANTQ